MARTKHNGNGRDPGQTHQTETPDVSHIKNIDVTHEASDVSVGGIVKFVVGLTVFSVIVSVLMWGLFVFLNAQEEKKESQPGPMAMSKEERLPPEPRLQSAPGFGVKLENGKWVPLENTEPEAEFRVLREQWEQKLNCKEPASSDHWPKPGAPVAQATDHAAPAADHGASSRPQTLTPCVPIDEAIEKLIEKGLPSRTASAASSTTAEDIALPTAASSGRVTGKGTR